MTPVEAVALVDPMSPDLLPGAGLTWCNLFVARVCHRLGVTLGGVLANEQAQWLRTLEAEAVGWRRLHFEQTVRDMAGIGRLVLVTYENPAGHGHIAVVVPLVDSVTHVAQAGAVNSPDVQLHSGQSFGGLPVEFHVFQPAAP